MIQPSISEGSLLFHATHGLCCVKQLIRRKESGKEALSYSLEPHDCNRMKMRFIIPAASIDVSGFHLLVSTAEANEILTYLKDGSTSALSQEAKHEAAVLAREIFSFSHESREIKDQRSRQRMTHSVNGLAGELAVVLKITLKEAARMIRKNLGQVSRINPLVISALENIDKNS